MSIKNYKRNMLAIMSIVRLYRFSLQLVFTVIFLLLLAQPNLYSKNFRGVGGFLRNPIGARAAAMGNAFVAVADDSSAFYHNPAGIATLNWAYFSTQVQRIPTDKYSATLSFVDPADINEKWAFGFALHSLTPAQSEIPSFVTSSKFKNFSSAGYFTIARKFGTTDTLKMGANIKVIYEKLDAVTGYGGGLDLGILKSISFINIAAVIQDVVTLEKFTGQKKLKDYDRILKLGLATNFSGTNAFKLSIQLDKNLSTNNKAIFRIGAYLKIWQRVGRVDYGFEKTKSFEQNFPKILENPEKEFDDEFYLNFGYGDGDIGVGFSLKIWGVSFDFTSSFAKLNWNDTTLLFTLNVPLY